MPPRLESVDPHVASLLPPERVLSRLEAARRRLGVVHRVLGWDVGGAHVKACLVEGHALRDVAQWACPLWQGEQHLDAVLALARDRWPQAWDAHTRHVATMTGEMVDLFADREQGVRRLAARLAESVGPSLSLYAGGAGRRAEAHPAHPANGANATWALPHEAGRCWREIASANWRATAQWLATRVDEALLIDIGSTTTDLVPLRDGRVAATGSGDFERLSQGELVYQGVVRTPLCALAQQVPFAGHKVNVINEFFATTADVYRLTGELHPEHDQQPPADGAAKDVAATHRRLARMVGRDAHDATPGEWLALALVWREAQLGEIARGLHRVAHAASLRDDAPIVGAGCGAFLAAELAARGKRPYRSFAQCALPPFDPDTSLARWAEVCAPAVAVALLASEEN